MPDVTGADAKTAAEQLRELGIAFTLMYDSDASKEAGVVLRQNVRAGDGVVKSGWRSRTRTSSRRTRG